MRFNVLKRDSFTCQYCGAKAPDVVLHVDHIKPVSEGGKDTLLNLVASCQPCNGGKGKAALDDQSAVEKSRRQLEQLQERREQIDMMIEWQDHSEKAEAVLFERFQQKVQKELPGWSPKPAGVNYMRRLLNKYGLHDACAAVDIAAERYAKFTSTGDITGDSWSKAFGALKYILKDMVLRREDPEAADVAKWTNIACAKWRENGLRGYIESLIVKARQTGWDWDSISRACNERNKTAFFEALESLAGESF